MKTPLLPLTAILFSGLFLFLSPVLKAQRAPCTPVAITVQPGEDYTCVGLSSTIFVFATGTNLVYTWEYSTDNINWVTLAADATYSGVTTATLAISNAPTAIDGYYYRCHITNPCSNIYTTSAPIHVGQYVDLSATIAGPAVDCGTTQSRFTVNVTNGGVRPYFTWYFSSSAFSTDASSFYTPSLDVPSGSFPPGTYTVRCEVLASGEVCAVPARVYSNTLTWTVEAGMVTPALNVNASAIGVCSGTPVTFTAVPTNGGASPSYAWTVNGTAQGTGTTFSSSTLVSSDVVKCTLTSSDACATPASVTADAPAVAVNRTYNPSVTVTASANPICAGTPVTFTATGTDLGTGEAYSWTVGGTYVGTTSTYTPSSLSDGAVVKCEVKVAELCTTVNPAISNAITMSVSQPVDVSLSVAASSAAVCAGTPVTFTALPVNGGATPSYSWTVNGTTQGSGATFSSSTLAQGDKVACVLTSDAGCVNSTTAAATAPAVAITQEVYPSLSIDWPASPVCAGAPVTFTALPVNQGPDPHYQWVVGSTYVGSDAPTYTSSTLANNTVVSCIMTVTDGCGISIASASVGPVVVSPVTHPAVEIDASASSICSGTAVEFTATATDAGVNPTYSWAVNGVFLASSPTYSSSTLGNGDVIKCEVKSSDLCAVNPGVSNTITEAVTSSVLVSLSIAASAPAICAGSPVTFTAIPTNGGADPTYAWTVNGSAVGEGPSFTASSLAPGDAVSCVLTSDAACATTPTASADAPVVTVNPIPVLTMMPDTLIGAGTSAVLHASSSVDIASWEWAPSVGLSNADLPTPFASPLSSTTYTLDVSSAAGCTASGKVTVDVYHTLAMPTGFTPNGDGRNDIFRVPPALGGTIRSFAIFDRWGKQVFLTQDVSTGWDGTAGGHAQPAGAYVWLIEYRDELSKTWVKASGTVVLVR